MSTDLTIVVPHSGEIVELSTAPLGQVASILTEIRDLESQLREVKQALTDRILADMDFRRAWILNVDGLKLTGKSDAPVVGWDAAGLVSELDAMVIEGVLHPEARDDAIECRIEWKVKARGVNALLKSPVFAERLERYRTEQVPDNRRVSVSRHT